MDNNELKQKLLGLIEKGESLSNVSQVLEISSLEVLGLVSEIQKEGLANINIKRAYDDIYLINVGDIEYHDRYTYSFNTNDDHEFKFIAISDTILGSKYQQLSILNDIYKKGFEFGFNNVILCGNISAGMQPLTGEYSDANFIEGTYGQIEYIAKNYPYIKGMKTYFISGKKDGTHLKKNKISIGKRIDELREDMIFLGEGSCDINIDNASMQLLAAKLGKTYTASYRAQQQIDSYRSEDKPDILLYGGLLQMEKFTHRDVHCISTPSVCATTKEMNDRRFSNTIGAWYVTVKTNEKGFLESVRAFNSPYYKTNKSDYKNAKVLKLGGR